MDEHGTLFGREETVKIRKVCINYNPIQLVL